MKSQNREEEEIERKKDLVGPSEKANAFIEAAKRPYRDLTSASMRFVQQTGEAWQNSAIGRVVNDPANGSRLSFATNLAFGAFKVFAGIMSMSVLVIISGLYNGVLCLSRFTSLAGRSLKPTLSSKSISEQEAESDQTMLYRAQKRTGMSVIVLGLVFMAFGLHMLINDTNYDFGRFYIVYGFVFMAFVKIIAAIVNIAKRKEHIGDVSYLTMKMTNLADAMASIALSQVALLNMENTADRSIWNGAFCAAVGVGIVIVGIILIVSIQRRIRAEAIDPQTQHGLDETLDAHSSSVHLAPITSQGEEAPMPDIGEVRRTELPEE